MVVHCGGSTMRRVLFVGDDWSEEFHDVELQDEVGRRLGKAKLGDGIVGIARLHAMIGEYVDEDAGPVEVVVGIETDRGPWVQALVASGYLVYPINPLQVARLREVERSSGGKSDAADAHTLADMVRTRRHTLRPMAGDSGRAETVKVLTRAHKTLIWERIRHTLRLRQMLREFFPAALLAFDDLAAPDTLELLGRAPDPASAARLSTAQITAALKRARRRDLSAKVATIQAALRSRQLGQPPAEAGAYAATVRAQVAILNTLNTEIATLEGQVEAHFGQHPAPASRIRVSRVGPRRWGRRHLGVMRRRGVVRRRCAGRGRRGSAGAVGDGRGPGARWRSGPGRRAAVRRGRGGASRGLRPFVRRRRRWRVRWRGR